MFQSNASSDFTFDLVKLGPPVDSCIWILWRCLSVYHQVQRSQEEVKVFKIDRTMERLEKVRFFNCCDTAIASFARQYTRKSRYGRGWNIQGPLLDVASESVSGFGFTMDALWNIIYLRQGDRVHWNFHATGPGLSLMASIIRISSTETFILNVLVDDSGKPYLTDFGLATVVGDEELQWSAETVERDFNCRFSAPEIIGIDCDPGRPTPRSDTYSFGGIMFLIVSGDIPWKEKEAYQISVALSKKLSMGVPTTPLTITGS